MDSRVEAFDRFAANTLFPVRGRTVCRRARILVEGDGRELLEEADDHERYFVVGELE